MRMCSSDIALEGEQSVENQISVSASDESRVGLVCRLQAVALHLRGGGWQSKARRAHAG